MKKCIRLLVCGDRNWEDKSMIMVCVLDLLTSGKKIDVIIEGEARGADSLARDVAKELGIPIEAHPAQWAKYGKQAGILRNIKMLEVGLPDLVMAFHDNIEESKGTKHMMTIAKKAGVKVNHFHHN